MSLEEEVRNSETYRKFLKYSKSKNEQKKFLAFGSDILIEFIAESVDYVARKKRLRYRD